MDSHGSKVYDLLSRLKDVEEYSTQKIYLHSLAEEGQNLPQRQYICAWDLSSAKIQGQPRGYFNWVSNIKAPRSERWYLDRSKKAVLSTDPTEDFSLRSLLHT